MSLYRKDFYCPNNYIYWKKWFLIYHILHIINFEKTPTFYGLDPVISIDGFSISLLKCFFIFISLCHAKTTLSLLFTSTSGSKSGTINISYLQFAALLAPQLTGSSTSEGDWNAYEDCIIIDDLIYLNLLRW